MQAEETSENQYSEKISIDLQDAKSEEIIWDYAFPLLTNPLVMLDMCKVIGISFGILCVLLLTIGAFQGGDNFADMLHLIPVMGLCVGVVVVIMVFVMLVIYRNRFPVRFTVNNKGVTIEVTKSQKKMNTAVILLGILGGNPGTAGSGLLAKSQECQSFGWVDVFHIKLFPGMRVVELRNSWRTVARIYCTAENYEIAARLANEGVERTTNARGKNIENDRKFKSQLVRDLFNRWLIIGIISFILSTASPLLENMTPLFVTGILLLLGLLTSGNVRRFFGYIGMGLVIVTVIMMILNGSVVHSFAGGYIKYSNYSSATSGQDLKFFMFSVIGMLGLTACCLRNIYSGAAGR